MGKDRNEMLKKFDSRISKLVPGDLSLARGSPEESKVVELIRWHYMKNKPLSEENLVDYFNVCIFNIIFRILDWININLYQCH